jgi:hypothetical protein
VSPGKQCVELYHLVARAPASIGDRGRQPGRFVYADEIGAEASGADDNATLENSLPNRLRQADKKQGWLTAEKAPFPREQLNALLDLAAGGIVQLAAAQLAALEGG